MNLQQLLSGGNPELIAAMQAGLASMVGTSSGYLEGLPAPVRSRISYLEDLQEEYDELEEKFEEELQALEEKYKALNGEGPAAGQFWAAGMLRCTAGGSLRRPPAV